MGWLFGGGDKPLPQMNADPVANSKCQKAVSDAARELVGSGVSMANVHIKARENAAESDVSCSIGLPHVQKAVEDVKRRR